MRADETGNILILPFGLREVVVPLRCLLRALHIREKVINHIRLVQQRQDGRGHLQLFQIQARTYPCDANVPRVAAQLKPGQPGVISRARDVEGGLDGYTGWHREQWTIVSCKSAFRIRFC